MGFHPKTAISRNKDERPRREHELRVVSSLILDYEAIRMNAGGFHLSRLSNGPMESLNRIAKDLKRNGHGYRNFEHLRNRFLFSQRKNASILAVPKTFEDACPKTDISRGPYKKKE